MLVNWNTREMTLECLRSVFAETSGIPFEVILVDNGSSDGSAEAIAAEFPQVTLMAEDANHGFAKATNISVANASGRYVLLLNTDTVVLDRAIERLIAFAQSRPEARIWGGRTLYGDRSLNPASAWGRITPWSMACTASGIATAFPKSELLNPECYGNWQRDFEREIDIVQGSFFLIGRDFWNELGGFDLEFFMYGEEADLCHRARQAGARPCMTPEATIVHYGGQSTKVSAQKFVYLLGSRIGLIDRQFTPFWKPFGRMATRFWAWWRASCYKAAAKLNAKHQADADKWGEVWQRREEWRDGPVRKA